MKLNPDICYKVLLTHDAHERLARDAAGLIEDGVLNESDIEGLAGQLGVTGRHLP